MRQVGFMLIGVVVFLVVLAAAALGYLRSTGLDSRAHLGGIETRMARARYWAIPNEARAVVNPLAATPEALADGMAHYADHCAACHANDGTGDTEMGRGLYPKAPDMRTGPTQELSDGELFYVEEVDCRVRPDDGLRPSGGRQCPRGAHA